MKSLSLLLLSASAASAAQIAFSNAVTTFDQGGSYAVAAAINGNLTDNLGWGVFGGQNAAQTSVFTAAAPVTTGEIGFSLPWFFGSGHYGQSFRISSTTDAAPSTGGNWTPVTPSTFRAANGGILGNSGNNILTLTTNPTAATTSFFLTSTAAFAGVTGFRLEMFTGTNGALGASANGNFVLTEFQADTADSINRALAAPVTSSASTYPGQDAAFLTDGNPGSLSHPADNAQNNFSFTVDLGGIIALTRLELFNRTGCCPERLSNYRVQVLDSGSSPVWTGDVRIDGSNSGNAGIDTITAAMGAGAFSGRYVRITNLSGNPYNPQIAEFKAFGAAIPEPATAMLAALALMVSQRRSRR